MSPRARELLGRAARIACASVAAAILAALAFLALVHVEDETGVDQVAGTWTALARYAGEGTLYPPLYDGERFGGTRYMPAQIGLHAGLARLTGDDLLAGKLLAFTFAAALCALLLVVLVRQLQVAPWVALALAAALFATPLGVLTATSIRGDALAALLQLGALAALTRWQRPSGAVGAGLLCAAAVLAKVTALWAPAAIVAWLLLRERRLLAPFAAAFLVPLGVTLLAVEAATDGRFSDNVLGLTAASAYGPVDAVRTVPTKLFTLLDVGADSLFLLLPLAVAGAVLAARGRTLGLYHLALGAAVLVALVTLADPGTTYNHLLDLGVLTVAVVGLLWSERGRGAAAEPLVALLVPAVALWGAVGSYALTMHGEVRNAVAIAAGRSSAAPVEERLAARIGPGDSLLSEEPWAALSLDRLPTVLDPYALLRIAEEHPEWEDDLVARLDGHEFDWVVLRYDHVRPDGRIELADPWWHDQNFGPTIVGAIARNYRFREAVAGYALYAPR